MEIRKVAVIGGGLMGRQIALNASICGYETKVTDSIEAVRTAVESWKEDYLAGRIAKGRMTAEQVASLIKDHQVHGHLLLQQKGSDHIHRRLQRLLPGIAISSGRDQREGNALAASFLRQRQAAAIAAAQKCFFPIRTTLPDGSNGMDHIFCR